MHVFFFIVPLEFSHSLYFRCYIPICQKSSIIYYYIKKIMYVNAIVHVIITALYYDYIILYSMHTRESINLVYIPNLYLAYYNIICHIHMANTIRVYIVIMKDCSQCLCLLLDLDRWCLLDLLYRLLDSSLCCLGDCLRD